MTRCILGPFVYLDIDVDAGVQLIKKPRVYAYFTGVPKRCHNSEPAFKRLGQVFNYGGRSACLINLAARIVLTAIGVLTTRVVFVIRAVIAAAGCEQEDEGKQ